MMMPALRSRAIQYLPKKTKNVPFTPVYFGFDSQFFKANENNRKPLTFITVGNLQHKSLYIRKGYDLIIELARRRPELSFTLVGWDGKTHIDVPKNVQLLPYMNQTEVKTAFTEHEFYFQLSVMEGDAKCSLRSNAVRMHSYWLQCVGHTICNW